MNIIFTNKSGKNIKKGFHYTVFLQSS